MMYNEIVLNRIIVGDYLKKFIKDNYKFIILLIFIAIIFWLPLPYYIDAPGGLTKLNNKVTIKNKSIDGSYNMTYVSEYKASIPLIVYSLFNKDYDVYKKEDILLNNETDSEYYKRDRLYLEESISNAVISAYDLAHIKVKKSNNYLYVGYILDDSNTNLKVGDNIVSIDGVKVNTKEEVNKLLSTRNINDKIKIEVNHGNKKYNRYAYLKEKNDKKIIGIIPIEVFDYETNPKVNIKADKNESGGSGGLMLSLTIYDLLSKDNISKNRVIAGTGTIDANGNVGEIGGVKYKIKGAVKNKADIFLVPEDNYKEAKKIVDKNKYKIKLVKVATLKAAVDYLKK